MTSYLEFDGINNFISLPPMNLDFSNGMTIDAWVQYNSFKRWSRIIDFANGPGADNIVFANEMTTNTLAFAVFRGGARLLLQAEGALETGKWTHLAVTVDPSGMAKLYKDGQLLKNKKLSLPANVNRTGNYIGKSHWATDGHFDGDIADVRVWTVARTGDEIKRDMSHRLTGGESGLACYWALDEAEGQEALDKTGNGNTGTINGATRKEGSLDFLTYGGPKQPISSIESVLSFDGKDDYIRIQEPFKNNSDFTISLWVNPSILNDGYYHGFIGKQGDAYRKPGLWIAPANGGLHYDSYSASDGSRFDSRLDNFFEATNQWVHVAWVKDGTEYKIYRNGEFFTTQPAPANFFTADTTYWIGRVDNFFAGQLAEVRIWSKARSREKINEDMFHSLSGTEPELAGYWPMTAGKGSKVQNKTGTGNNGTICGAIWQPISAQFNLPPEPEPEIKETTIAPTSLQTVSQIAQLKNYLGIHMKGKRNGTKKKQHVGSREYKIMLSAKKFEGDYEHLMTQACNFWCEFAQFVGQLGIKVTGNLDTVVKNRSIKFYDTETKRLNSNDYIFREREDLMSGKKEVTLKCRHLDRYISQERNMKGSKNGKYKIKFEQDIKPELRKLYSFSVKQKISSHKKIDKMSHPVELFPDLINNLDDFHYDEELKVVGSFTAQEVVIAGGGFQICKSPRVIAKCALIVWYDMSGEENTPLVAEFSFKYGRKKEKYTRKMAARAYTVFKLLQSYLGSWTDPNSKTKTAYVYGRISG